MATSALRGLAIGIEPEYCSYARSGTPSGVSFNQADFVDVTQLLAEGEAIQWTYADSRPGFWNAAREFARYTGSGNPVLRGSLTVDFLLRSWGGGAVAGEGLLRLLQTRFYKTEPSAAIDTGVTVGSTGALTGLSSAVSVGAMVARTMPDGRVTYGMSRSSSSVNPTLTPSASWGTATTVSVLRPMTTGTITTRLYQLYSNYVDLPYGTSSSGSVRSSYCLRIFGDGWQQYCCGCVLSALKISPEGDGAIRVSCTLDVGAIVNVQASPDFSLMQPQVVRGPLLRAQGSPHIVNRWGNAIVQPLTAPLYCRTWSLQVDWTLAKNADGASDYAGEPPEAIDCSVVAECVYVDHSALYNAVSSYKDSYYSVLIPFGGSLQATNLYGGCIMLPQAVVDDIGAWWTPDVSGDQVCRRYRWRASNNQTSNFPALSLMVY